MLTHLFYIYVLTMSKSQLKFHIIYFTKLNLPVAGHHHLPSYVRAQPFRHATDNNCLINVLPISILRKKKKERKAR